MAKVTRVKIDIYNEFNKDLENIWTMFEKNTLITPFQSYAWLSHWQHIVGEPLLSIHPQIIHLHTNDHTIAILPMGIRKMFGVRILEWLGLHQADYMGQLIINNYDSENYDNNIWELIKNKLCRFDVIHLRKQFGGTVKFLESINISLSSNQNLKAYKTSLPEKWNDYFGNIKKRLRSDSQRQRRRLEAIGNVRFVYAESSKEKDEIIKAMIVQKSRRYRETKVWDMLGEKEYQKFYKGLAKLTSNNCKVHCASLSVGTTLVATHIGIFDDETFYYLMPANEGGDWKKYSPGRLLLLELFQWSIKNNLKFFDFTVGGETYKKDWCDIETDLFEICKSFSSFGFVYIFSLFIKKKLKKVKFLRRIVRAMRK